MCAASLEARSSGPLLQYYGGFAEYLAARGYTAKHARKLKKLCRDLDQWLANVNLGVGELRRLEIDRFQAAQKSAGRRVFVSARALTPLLTYLREVGVAPIAPACVVEGPLESLLQRYRGYLRTERGIKDDTTRTYVSLVRPFLETRVSVDGAELDLRTLSEADVINFVVATCPKMGKGVASLSVTALRSILTFLHVDGIIDRSLTSAVPTVPGRRLTGLPRGLDPGVTERLLASCNIDTHSGSRSFAVLTMLIRLRLRAGELAKLQLDDIKWRTGEVMIVQSKSNRTDSLPLPQCGHQVDDIAGGRHGSAATHPPADREGRLRRQG
jgi:integrase/recombinase XerD